MPSFPAAPTLAALSMAAVAACIAPSRHLTLLDPTPRPSRPSEEIEVLTEEPERPFDVVALWEGKEESVYGDQVGPLERAAVERAAELGVDAVIVSANVESGMPIKIPTMVPGVATGGLESTTFESVTRMRARLVVWRGEPGGSAPR